VHCHLGGGLISVTGFIITPDDPERIEIAFTRKYPAIWPMSNEDPLLDPGSLICPDAVLLDVCQDLAIQVNLMLIQFIVARIDYATIFINPGPSP
jgi:hypothetical protein